MLSSPWIAALAALFLWWFSTGAILFAVRKADKGGPHSRLWACLMTLPIVVLGIAGFLDTLSDSSVVAVYVAFLATLAVWGWIELTFLTGTITGPITSHSVPNVSEGERFIRAWGTIAYHEMLLAAVMVAMIILSWGAENQFGMWTFAVLFVARISAKLNLYLGVRKVNVEFIPEPLEHLPSHFRTARMNWLFPMSITALSFTVACWLERLWVSESQADIVGFALLSALTALALLEHWFMVLPLPDEKLWRWMLPERPQPAQATRLSEEVQ